MTTQAKNLTSFSEGIADNGNVGIGTTSPGRQLSIVDDGTNGQAIMEVIDSTNNNLAGIFLGRANNTNIGGMRYFHSTNHLALRSNDEDALIIDSSGNVGIGVTPHAGWYDNATALQISPVGALYNTSNWEDLNLANNVYINSSGTDSYIQNDAACKIRLTDAGLMDFRVAGAGTAGNAISWDTAFSINALGRVGVGLTQGDPVKFEVNSGTDEYKAMRIRFTDDNNSNATANPFSFEYKNVEIENSYSGAAPNANGTKVAKLQLTTVTSSGYAANGSIMALATSTGYDSGELVFSTGSNSSGLETERMRIGRTGNVGIGVTNPATPLQIYQSTNATAGDQKPTPVLTLSAHTNSDNEGPAIEFNSAWVNSGSYLASTINNGWGVAKIAGVYDDDQGNGGALSFYTNEGPSATSGATSTQLTEKMRIKPNGNVGIGMTSPSDKLDIQGADNGLTIRSITANRPVISLINGSSTMLKISANGTYGAIGDGTDANRYMSFRGGNVGIGTTSPDTLLHVKGAAALTGTTGGANGLSIAYDGGNSSPLYFGTETNSAQKSMYMSGYWMYIRGHQNEGIRFVFSQGAGSGPRSDQYQFKYNSATRPTGNTTWDGFSDVRAKENVQNVTGALDTISQLRPVVFDWTDDYADTMNMFEMDTTDEHSYNHISVKENGYDLTRKNGKIGFIAQEFETVFPKDITELEVQLGDEKVEDFKTVNYDSLIPTLTKAIQEQQAQIQALQQRLDDLEG